jgi:hypothetical protein
MGISDPGDRGKLDAAIVREVIRSYSYVALWMSVSIAVILFNKARTMCVCACHQHGTQRALLRLWELAALNSANLDGKFDIISR